MNGVDDVVLPSGLVTLISPEVAPTGTVNSMVILSMTLNKTDSPFNVTKVTLSKLVPTIVTVYPTESLIGENDVMVGGCGNGGTTMNLPPLALPEGFSTVICPDVAPTGTTNVIVKLSTIVNGTLKFLIFTIVALIKLIPSIVTNVPSGPDVGLTEVIDGLVDLGPCAFTLFESRNVETTNVNNLIVLKITFNLFICYLLLLRGNRSITETFSKPHKATESYPLLLKRCHTPIYVIIGLCFNIFVRVWL